jgi:Ca-activated chloride channel family protein
MAKHKATVLCLAALFLAPGLVHSQSAPEQTKAASAPPAAQPGRQRPPFRAEVDQVVVYAAIYDKLNQLVTGLTQDDFSIFEDKTPQQITYFGADDLPSTVGIVVDCSGSMRSKIDTVIDAIKLFLSLNNPENELFLIRFNDKVELEEGFTNDQEDIRDALDNLIVSGGTALYDAIVLAVDEARKGSEPRKAIIVFTDGQDKDSYYKHEELLSKVEESDVQVHIVAFLDAELSSEGGFFGVLKSEKEKISNLISSISDASGGKTIFPERVDQLKPAFESIAHDLRNQYRLAYISTNTARDGSWRRVDVQVKDAKEKGLRVRAKKGYKAPKS